MIPEGFGLERGPNLEANLTKMCYNVKKVYSALEIVSKNFFCTLFRVISPPSVLFEVKVCARHFLVLSTAPTSAPDWRGDYFLDLLQPRCSAHLLQLARGVERTRVCFPRCRQKLPEAATLSRVRHFSVPKRVRRQRTVYK